MESSIYVLKIFPLFREVLSIYYYTAVKDFIHSLTNPISHTENWNVSWIGSSDSYLVIHNHQPVYYPNSRISASAMQSSQLDLFFAVCFHRRDSQFDNQEVETIIFVAKHVSIVYVDPDEMKILKYRAPCEWSICHIDWSGADLRCPGSISPRLNDQRFLLNRFYALNSLEAR